MKHLTSLTATTLLALSATSAHAAFTSYVIRDGASGSPTIQANNDYVSGATEFIISEANMKAGWGTNGINGLTLGQVTGMGITRHDDSSRFTAGSGPAVAPYLNLWITDGAGQYAVIANEPSNPSFATYRTSDGNGGYTYDFTFNDIANEAAKVYETPGWNDNTSWVHTATGETSATLTFADLLGFTIEAPSAAYIADGANSVGGGAPDVIGTNEAFGFNWVFGDSLSNYVSGNEGYVVSSPSAVPEPGSIALLGLGGLALLRRRRSMNQ